MIWFFGTHLQELIRYCLSERGELVATTQQQKNRWPAPAHDHQPPDRERARHGDDDRLHQPGAQRGDPLPVHPEPERHNLRRRSPVTGACILRPCPHRPGSWKKVPVHSDFIRISFLKVSKKFWKLSRNLWKLFRMKSE